MELERLVEGDGAAAGEIRENGPVVVVTAMELWPEAREALAEMLGPGHVVRDIREAGHTADIVLVPSTSAQLVGGLRAMFRDARILVTEFTDERFAADFAGPVARSAASGVDGYFVVPSLEELAAVTYRAAQGRPAAGLLTSGRSAAPELAQDSSVREVGPPNVITIDLDDQHLDDSARTLVQLIIGQLRDQGIDVVLRTGADDESA